MEELATATTTFVISRTGAAGALLVFSLDILARVVRHHGGRDQGQDGADKDVEGDRVGRTVLGEQPSGDQRRRASGNDRGELIAERCAAVAQTPRERLCDQR